MKRLAIHRELNLSPDAQLAFERAFALFLAERRVNSRRAFAEFLLGRAAHAYALASWNDRTSWWAFDLRPIRPEEKAAADLLDQVRRQP